MDSNALSLITGNELTLMTLVDIFCWEMFVFKSGSLILIRLFEFELVQLQFSHF